MQAISFTNSVFINCPFDKDYEPLLYAILFTVFRCGFIPRSALEEDDGSEIRLEKIIRLIQSCKFGIHDLSRIELDKHNSLPRFNMPFELGLFWGAKKFGNNQQKEKIALIFEKKRYQYQQYISDLNGVDVKSHDGKNEMAIKSIRNWLQTASGRKTIPSYNLIVREFVDFINKDFPVLLQKTQAAPHDITYNDFCAFVDNSLKAKNKQRLQHGH